MSKAPRKMPSLASLDPILGALLREGSKTEQRVPCDTKKEATAFMYQLNVYRQTAQKENAPGWQLLYAAEVRRDKTDESVVIVAPKNSLARKRIEAIGIKVEPDPNDFLKKLQEDENKP